ncbi:response regulator transcription factor [Runella sp. MFBS21]|uniref:response regulator n=1 Tax=Runella sp. MFBS21 TaxID=3034018 RepID=UPI0023F9F2EA|nr:response regulator transcription factor [Runella sp. MFBS21]MDF7819592.1 response regulator transcription factor [Runella sp. MFBS21]
MQTKILIVDDHTLFNEGIRQLLQEDYHIIGQVYDGKNVLHEIQSKNPDVVLLDINLPTINGLDLAKNLKYSFPALKIIFLSMYSEPRFVEQAKQLNIDGYLLKHSTKRELIIGIQKVLEGSQYFDSKLQDLRSNLHHDDYFVKTYSLTPREVEIIKMIKRGISNPQIAEELFIAEETVKSHRKNIYYKLGVKNVVELVEFANKNGL